MATNKTKSTATKSSALATIDRSVLSVAKTRTGKIKALSIPGLQSRMKAPLAQIMPTMKLKGYTFIPMQLFGDSCTVYLDRYEKKEDGVLVTTLIQKFLRVELNELGIAKIGQIEHEQFTDGSSVANEFIMTVYRKVSDKAITYPLKRLLKEDSTDEITIISALEESFLRHYIIPENGSKEILECLVQMYLSAVNQDVLLSNLTAKELVDYLIVPTLPSRGAQPPSLPQSDDQF